MAIETLGIDLAKSVFQLHAVDTDGAVVMRKRLRRGALFGFLGKLEPCLIRDAGLRYISLLGPRDSGAWA